jgi:hypothetical protein
VYRQVIKVRPTARAIYTDEDTGELSILQEKASRVKGAIYRV